MNLQSIVSKTRIPLYIGLTASALASDPQYSTDPPQTKAIVQSWSSPGRIKPYEGWKRFQNGLRLEQYENLVAAEMAPLSAGVARDCGEYQTLIGWLAREASDRRGFFRDDNVNRLIAKFNAYQELKERIDDQNFPSGFKETLKRFYRGEVMTEAGIPVTESYLRSIQLQKQVDAIPKDCRFHEVRPGEKLEEILPRYYPAFSTMDSDKARGMMDFLAGFNPGLKKLGDHDVGYRVGREFFQPSTKGKFSITVSSIGKGRTYYYDVAAGSTIAFPRDQDLVASRY